MDEAEVKQKAKGFLAHINRESTFRGSISSTMRATMSGAGAVGSAARQLRVGFGEAMQPGRVETFQQAMTRLGIGEQQLALIHNQILLQVYASALLCVIAITVGVQYLLSAQVGPGIMALVIGVACAIHFAQASIRTLQIREKSLGLGSSWIGRPGEWLPSRMGGLEEMGRGDPLREPGLVNSLARRSQRSFGVAIGALAGAIGLQMAEVSNVPVAWVGVMYLLAIVFAANAARLSFETFRRRIGIDCDVLLWIGTPSKWIPAGTSPVKGGGNAV